MSDRLVEALEDARPAFERISAEVWDLCELSLGEIESAEVHARELEAGFEVSFGTSGIETAFVAERRLGDGPVVGFLAESTRCPSSATRRCRASSLEPTGRRVATAADTTCWVQR